MISLKLLLLALGLVAAAALVPAATGSHNTLCRVSDVECVAWCMANTLVGHDCSIEAERLIDRCPSGEGVVVYVDGNGVPVCV